MLNELRSEIRHAVESYCDDPDLRDAMLQVLSRPDCALHANARCTAGLLTLKTYEAICGAPTAAAFQAAVAMEMYVYAARIFDNVADEEIDSTQGMTVAEELPIAIGLMSCGGIAACEAGKLAGSDTQGLRLLLQLQRDCLKSCNGQFMDARLQRHSQVSTDEALEMSCRKSGSLGRLAAALGAIIATEHFKIIGLFEEFGFNLFTYLQLLDDMRDACPSDGPMRDLEQNKKTLPLAYFHNILLEELTEAGDGIIRWEYDKQSRQDICQEFGASGAVIFCAIIAETFLNRAKSNLVALKNRVRTVEGLEQFVSSLEISLDEVNAATQAA
ncbi:polyprenyl synthetase family protein [Chloroflexota bacterium]